MSKQSGTAAISLPKGGGALAGLGESFSPDLHTGTGNFSVPIEVPRGRNGFQPQLQLVYSTGAGNGPFGLGWSLSIPGVTRKTARGVPRYRDRADDPESADTFLLSGAEDLVPVAREPGGIVRYRPRTEGLFARIERHADAANDFWRVWSPDGLLSTYGTPAALGADPATVADPRRRAQVFAWNLSRTVDPFGNAVEYHYERDTGEEAGHHWDQLYLQQIRYAEYAAGASGEQRFLITITFEYEPDPRPDAFSTYRAGFEIRTRRRCRRIVIATHADQPRVVRTYELAYTNDSPNGVSLLREIAVVGHDGAQTEAFPPLAFSYTAFAPEQRDLRPVVGPLPAHSLAHPDLELVDLFGSGLPDILHLGETVRYWRNLGAGRFDLPRPMADAPAGLRLSDPGVQLIDADGDGRTDLLVTNEQIAGYFPLRHDGGWERRGFQRYAAAPSFNLEDPAVRLIDLDGDGVTDALRSGSRIECFFNDPRAGWGELRLVERQALAEFPDLDFADPRVKWGDMSGDGLQSPVLIHDGSIAYWPNLGYGSWGRRIVMRNSPRLPRDYDLARLLLGDVDGDGLDDLVYVDHGRVLVWINQSGNGWSDPIEIRGTPPVSDSDAVRLVDLLGAGIVGVLWSADAGSQARQQMLFLDVTGGVKPYLLHEMDNHMGAVTRVAYAPSTRFYLQDQHSPATRWRTSLPFPVQVVAASEVIDALSGGKLTTEYRYHHGYWDGVEREFRGFGRVDQRDTEVFASYAGSGLHGSQAFAPVAERQFAPPIETRTWFHQGPISDGDGGWAETDFSAEYWPGDRTLLERPAAMRALLAGLPSAARRDALRTLRGTILRTEVYALDDEPHADRPYTVTETITGVREESPSDDSRRRIFFPHGLARRVTQWERGHEPMTSFTFTDDYDPYGQPRAQIEIAVPRGRDPLAAAATSEPYLAMLTITDYARLDAERYIVDRVARETSYEIGNDGRLALPDLLAAIRDRSAERRVISQTLTFYDGPAFDGLPLGQLGGFGAPVRGETLVLTEPLLHEAYRDDSAPGSLDAPPYLRPDGAPVWTADYPQSFRDALPTLAGYVFYDDADHARGYFATTSRQRYDFHELPAGGAHGLVTARRDPLGHETTIAYDAYALLPIRVTDPAGLITSAEYDYRVLQPQTSTDPNGNRRAYRFTPLGLLASIAVLGRPGEAVGDTLDAPSTRLLYDLSAFAERGQPISARTIQRVHHRLAADVPPAERDATIETIEYTDGFGRLLQKRAQAEDRVFGDPIFGDDLLPVDLGTAPGAAIGRERGADALPNVVVSGWQVYDNKGRVVEKYEPFLATGWDYQPPSDAQRGQKVSMHYDPRGQMIRTVNPDGSEQRVIYGVPTDLARPEQFTPTPWAVYSYDANDNAGRTHAAGDARHWNTPTSAVLDALGRVVEVVERAGLDPATDWHTTRSTYDLRGNLLAVTDALGRIVFRYVYDLLPRGAEDESPAHMLRIEQLDAGVRRTVFDAAGNPVEQRDSKGALLLHGYDQLSRPIRRWARDGAGEALTLRERLLYGDSPEAGLAPAQQIAANLRGQLFRHYDEAGLLTLESYDLQGNLLEQTRQPIDDAPLLAVFAAAAASGWRVQPFRVDWQPPADTTLADHAARLLEGRAHRTSLRYDALSRVVAAHYPAAVDGARRVIRPRYNRAGALERVEVDGVPFVEQIAYNARGQRTLIAYGNGVLTRYAYDPRTTRLARLRTERYTRPEPLRYQPVGAPLEEYGYAYDLIGNLVTLRNRTPGGGLPNTPLGADALDRSFAYDPLYRLLEATGRECDLPAPLPWETAPRCADPTRVRPYTETYEYDALGNLSALHHRSGAELFSRKFGLAAGGNRLAVVTTGSADYSYSYDANGNQVRETLARHFEWDHSDRMRVFRVQTDGAEPSVYAQYLYDAEGRRVKKLVRKQGGLVEATVAIDDLFEQHRRVAGGTTHEHTTLHVMDDERRLALLRIGAPLPGDTTPAVQYHLGDHLDSSALVVDQAGDLISREEYTPFGETSFGSFSRKRFRFGGKERDEESGLAYYGARFYAPWLARWTSCDPIYVDGERMPERSALKLNLYVAFAQNPLRYVDRDGRDDEIALKAAGRKVASPTLARQVFVLFLSLLGNEPDPNAETRPHGPEITTPRPGERPPRQPQQPAPPREQKPPTGKRGQRSYWRRMNEALRWTGQGKSSNPMPSPSGPAGVSQSSGTVGRLARAGNIAAQVGRVARTLSVVGNVASVGNDTLQIIAREAPERLPEGITVELTRPDRDMPIMVRPTGFFVQKKDGKVRYFDKAGNTVSRERAVNATRMNYAGEA